MKHISLWLPVLLAVLAQAQNGAPTSPGNSDNAIISLQTSDVNLSGPNTAVGQTAAGSASSSDDAAARQSSSDGPAGVDHTYNSSIAMQNTAVSPAPDDNASITADWSTATNSSNVAAKSCLDSPSQEQCMGFEYSNDQVNEDLKDICSSMACLSGCSIFRLCTEAQTDRKAIGQAPDMCDNFRLLATVCGSDSLGVDQQGCSHYRSLCLSQNSQVQQCRSSPGLSHIVPTAAARQLSRSICEGPRSPDSCRRCDWSSSQPACDFLSIYGALCTASPDMSECTVWRDMCSTDPTLYVCRQQKPGGQPGPAAVAKLFSQSPSPPTWTSGGPQANERCRLMTWTAAAIVVAAVLL